jgi:hypothetical protein
LHIAQLWPFVIARRSTRSDSGVCAEEQVKHPLDFPEYGLKDAFPTEMET